MNINIVLGDDNLPYIEKDINLLKTMIRHQTVSSLFRGIEETTEFINDEGRLSKTLSDSIVSDITSFLEDTINNDVKLIVGNIITRYEKIRKGYDGFTKADHLFEHNLSEFGNIISENYDYINNYAGKDVEAKSLGVYINGHAMGYITMFTKKGDDGLQIQGIAKSVPMHLISYLSSVGDQFPKLNSIIIPEVLKYAHSLNKKYIYVYPLSNQGRILSKHYGFKGVPYEALKKDNISKLNRISTYNKMYKLSIGMELPDDISTIPINIIEMYYSNRISDNLSDIYKHILNIWLINNPNNKNGDIFRSEKGKYLLSLPPTEIASMIEEKKNNPKEFSLYEAIRILVNEKN